MKPDKGPLMRFSKPDAGAVPICLICRERGGVHLPTCPIVALDAQIRELTAHTGTFVASIRDTLETIARILRDERL